MPHFLLLGILGGWLGVLLTKTMSLVEHQTDRLRRRFRGFIIRRSGRFFRGCAA